MRIGIVSPYSLTVPGGVQGQVLGLARALRARGHEAVALGPCDGPPPDTGVIPLGDSIPTASNGSVAPIAPDAACALRTIRALWEEEFDVIHLHEPLVPGPNQTALLLDTAPMIGTWHAAGKTKAYLVPGVRYLANRLRVRCAVSEDAKALASEALGGEYEVLFNGIELARFAKAEPYASDRPTILFLGRHEPRKGLAVLLDALAHLPHDVRVWVAGSGPETERLQRRHAGDGRIEWLGSISETEKLGRLRGADVACFPSLASESFGIVLLEAMAAGTTLVASSLDGYQNVATHDRDALLAPPGDAAALGAALHRALFDAGLSERLVQAGSIRAEELSMDRLAGRYLELYDAASQPGRLGELRWSRTRRLARTLRRS
ncbi:MAG: glycosyltransferase family 4 protein [Actinomycetota bacterium]